MKSIKILLTLLLFILIGFSTVYYLLVNFTESEIIKPNSIKSWLRIPDSLKENSLAQIGVVENYKYWPQDGTSFSTFEASVSVNGEKEAIEKKIKQYFLINGFTENEKHEFWKGNQQFDFVMENNGNTSWRVNISLMDY